MNLSTTERSRSSGIPIAQPEIPGTAPRKLSRKPYRGSAGSQPLYYGRNLRRCSMRMIPLHDAIVVLDRTARVSGMMLLPCIWLTPVRRPVEMLAVWCDCACEDYSRN